MFLPEVYGLEHEIALSNVVRTTADRFFLRHRIRVSFRDGDREREFTLFLKQPDDFLRLVSSGERSLGA